MECPPEAIDFHIAVICALKIEADAVQAVFDRFWDECDGGDGIVRAHADSNHYTTGTIGKHNVVLAHMPEYGKGTSARVAANIRTTFPDIRVALVVGVCGGLPETGSGQKILLGDVIVSTEITEHDLGRQLPSGFRPISLADRSLSDDLRTFLSKMQGNRQTRNLKRNTATYLAAKDQAMNCNKPARPEATKDRLFRPDYRHKHHMKGECGACDSCDGDKGDACIESQKLDCENLGCSELVVNERERDERAPHVHFGGVASGDTVMKSGNHRETLAKQLNVVAFEMEGAGVARYIPCFVIKGVCDYADSHKNKAWQSYAAATAAACTKALLKAWQPSARPWPHLVSQMQRPENFSSITGAHARGIHTGSGDQHNLGLNPPDPLQPSDNCLKSLAFDQMRKRFFDLGKYHAAKGTCEWLPRHKVYRRWTACDRGLLWIEGKPGSGKSTLLKYLLGKYEDENYGIGASDLVLSFFFHDRGVPLQKTPLGLFRALLHQILSQVPAALSDLVEAFEKKRKENCEVAGWHPEELWCFFESSLPKVLKTRSVWLFIDALDECGKPNANESDRQADRRYKQDLNKLVQKLKSLLKLPQPSSSKQFHICVTCRHYPVLDLDHEFEIRPENENHYDISAFVGNELAEFSMRTSSTIPISITTRASGAFMWARLVVDRVLELDMQGVPLKEIEVAVHSIPEELEELYRQLTRDMGSDSSRLMIQWICFATRPLLMVELWWAMAIEPNSSYQSLRTCEKEKKDVFDSSRMKRRVETLSRGLAEVTSFYDKHAVQFIHQSVKDFFVEEGLSILNKNSLLPVLKSPESIDLVGKAHYQLSRTCIRYLAMEEIAGAANYDYLGITSMFPFLEYATASWVTHMKQSDDKNGHQEDLLEYFAWPSNALVGRWVRMYGLLKAGVSEKYSSECPPRGTNLVHVMSTHGVISPLRAMLQRADLNSANVDINAKDEYGRTPLSWAAARGHEAIVQLLVKTGKADVDAKDIYGRTPLWYAAVRGYGPIVQTLVEAGGVSVDAKDISNRTPLSYVVERGYEAIVQLLVGSGRVDVNAKDGPGRTPLSYAAERGYEAIVQLLVKTGKVDVDAKSGPSRTPLSYAAERGHKAIVQLLVETGKVDVDAKDKYGWTPLLYAAEQGYKAITQLLVETGKVDIDTKDKSGWTPLLYTAARGHGAITQLLVETGKADLNAKDEFGRTPLSLAAVQGHKSVVQLLVETGKVDVESKDGFGRTPLSYAAAQGHKAVVRLLQKYHAQPLSIASP